LDLNDSRAVGYDAARVGSVCIVESAITVYSGQG